MKKLKTWKKMFSFTSSNLQGLPKTYFVIFERSGLGSNGTKKGKKKQRNLETGTNAITAKKTVYEILKNIAKFVRNIKLKKKDRSGWQIKNTGVKKNHLKNLPKSLSENNPLKKELKKNDNFFF